MTHAVSGYGVLNGSGGLRTLVARTPHGVVDLPVALEAGVLGALPDELADALRAPLLGPLMAGGREARELLAAALAGAGRDAPLARTGGAHALPFDVADYVDYFAARHHAQNCGRILRPGSEPLTPNWEWMPVGYHGRAGTVVVSGTPVRRPRGQLLGAGGVPAYAPSAMLDLEVELGLVIGTPSQPGEPVPVADAEHHIFGLVLLNDWSARDIQGWESAPLGPHLGKSFATSISAWVVPWEALGDVRAAPHEPAAEPLDYLADAPGRGLELELELRVGGQLVSRCSALDLAWTPAQLVAHTTANGAALRTGDLLGSGTISGAAPESRGCLLERSWAGREPVELADGRRLAFLQDGDEVVISGRAGALELGEVRGVVTPAANGAA